MYHGKEYFGHELKVKVIHPELQSCFIIAYIVQACGVFGDGFSSKGVVVLACAFYHIY